MANHDPPKNRSRNVRAREPSARQLEVEQHELEVEQGLLRRLPPQQIARALATRWSTTERTVWAYIARVRARWEREAADGGRREEARDHMRASLNDVYAKAMGRRAALTDDKGVAILDQKTGQPMMAERPDLNNAIKAARLLVDLDALQQPPPVQALTIAATVQATVDPADAAALSAYLTRIAPPSE